MIITFNYYAQIRKAAGVESECVEIAGGATLLDALKTIDHGADFKALLFDAQGVPHPVVLFLVNDLPAAPGQTLNDGDRVSVFSPVAGG
jgi:molybdopterin converting factor small subunit